jgi:tetratricopeptide (TPR) repeat protein
MRTRFLAVLLAAAVPAALAVPSLAQRASPPAPPKKLPQAQLDNRTHSLDFLFGALKAAPDEETAKAIEARIWAIWAASRSDTTDLLMSRVQKAVEDNDNDLALKLLGAVVQIKPDFVQGWNQRATLYFMKRDYGRALVDISHVLKLEPRHFGALTGLGMILQDIGDDRQALEVFRRALAVDPHLEHIPDAVKSLTEKVEGRDI